MWGDIVGGGGVDVLFSEGEVPLCSTQGLEQRNLPIMDLI